MCKNTKNKYYIILIQVIIVIIFYKLNQILKYKLSKCVFKTAQWYYNIFQSRLELYGKLRFELSIYLLAARASKWGGGYPASESFLKDSLKNAKKFFNYLLNIVYGESRPSRIKISLQHFDRIDNFLQYGREGTRPWFGFPIDGRP